MSRYAIYFTPAPDSPLWQAGCAWLGRDAETGRSLSQPMLDGVSPDLLRTLTATPRRYGFHATLKAPFTLRPGLDEKDVLAAARAFCSARLPFLVDGMEVARLHDFLALRPAGSRPAISGFSMACVRHFDELRQPVERSSTTSKYLQMLNERQKQNLSSWGYPHVGEDFRFHFTLTDSLAGRDESVRCALETAASRWFGQARASAPLSIDGIAIFMEPASGADFRLIRRIAFAA